MEQKVFIEWNDSLATGLPDLDSQHREIINRLNDFYNAMLGGESSYRAEAGKVLDFLQFYAGWHFQREEEYMEKYRCAAAEENKRQHAIFLRDFGSFYAQWQSGGMKPELARETFLGLIRWIGNHIQKVDTQLFPLVTAK